MKKDIFIDIQEISTEAWARDALARELADFNYKLISAGFDSVEMHYEKGRNTIFTATITIPKSKERN